MREYLDNINWGGKSWPVWWWGHYFMTIQMEKRNSVEAVIHWSLFLDCWCDMTNYPKFLCCHCPLNIAHTHKTWAGTIIFLVVFIWVVYHSKGMKENGIPLLYFVKLSKEGIWWGCGWYEDNAAPNKSSKGYNSLLMILLSQLQKIISKWDIYPFLLL